MRIIFIVTILVTLCSSGRAQDSLQVGAYIRIDWENDAFQIRQRSVTDRYYTNGMSVSHLSNYWHRWPTRHALLTLLPQGARSYLSLYSLTVGQEIYTPRNSTVAKRPLYPNDRPYAGYLYASWGLTTTDPVGGRRLTSALTIGAIGPISGAAEVQQNLHRFLDQRLPAGWGTQMKNDLAISYSVNYEGRIIRRFSPFFDIIGHVEGTIGSLTNFAGTGGTLRVGLFNDYFVNPVGQYMPMSGTSQRKFQCYAFVRAGFRAVLDNALLQGGWLNGKNNYYALPAVELRHFYGQTDVGGVVAFKNAQLSFIQHLRTAEFVKALDAQWGHLSLLVRVGPGPR